MMLIAIMLTIILKMRIKIINTDNNVNNDENNRYIEYNSYYGKQYCYNNDFHKSS